MIGTKHRILKAEQNTNLVQNYENKYTIYQEVLHLAEFITVTAYQSEAIKSLKVR